MSRIRVTNTCKHDTYHMWNFYILPSLELWKDNMSEWEDGGSIILTFRLVILVFKIFVTSLLLSVK